MCTYVCEPLHQLPITQVRTQGGREHAHSTVHKLKRAKYIVLTYAHPRAVSKAHVANQEAMRGRVMSFMYVSLDDLRGDTRWMERVGW